MKMFLGLLIELLLINIITNKVVTKNICPFDYEYIYGKCIKDLGIFTMISVKDCHERCYRENGQLISKGFENFKDRLLTLQIMPVGINNFYEDREWRWLDGSKASSDYPEWLTKLDFGCAVLEQVNGRKLLSVDCSIKLITLHLICEEHLIGEVSSIMLVKSFIETGKMKRKSPIMTTVQGPINYCASW